MFTGMVGKYRKTRKRRQQGKKQRQKYLMETILEKKNEDTMLSWLIPLLQIPDQSNHSNISL